MRKPRGTAGKSGRVNHLGYDKNPNAKEKAAITALNSLARSGFLKSVLPHYSIQLKDPYIWVAAKKEKIS